MQRWVVWAVRFHHKYWQDRLTDTFQIKHPAVALVAVKLLLWKDIPDTQVYPKQALKYNYSFKYFLFCY